MATCEAFRAVCENRRDMPLCAPVSSAATSTGSMAYSRPTHGGCDVGDSEHATEMLLEGGRVVTRSSSPPPPRSPCSNAWSRAATSAAWPALGASTEVALSAFAAASSSATTRTSSERRSSIDGSAPGPCLPVDAPTADGPAAPRFRWDAGAATAAANDSRTASATPAHEGSRLRREVRPKSAPSGAASSAL
eukprot:4800665-Prymnesium_polylepis.1